MDSRNLEKIISLRHDLHAHAELSNEEVWTKDHLMKFLKDNTSLEIVDRGAWFYSYYRSNNSDKTIAFVADFDALPIQEDLDISYKSINKGVSHKCGHDGHAAALAGLCLELDKEGSDKDVYCIFQHAEEIGTGAKEAASIVEEKGIDEVYKIHSANYHKGGGFPEGSVIYSYGINNYASTGINIKFLGKESHASLPEDGRNPAFAIAKLVSFIEDFTKSNLDRNFLATIIAINLGGKNYGKSPGYGELSMTVRAEKEDFMKLCIEKILKRADELVKDYGLDMDIEYSDYFPEVYNHKKNIDKVKQAAKNLKLELFESGPARSSEDFGYYTQLTKGAYFMIGNGEGYPQAHTKEFDYNDKILEPSVNMFKELLKI